MIRPESERTQTDFPVLLFQIVRDTVHRIPVRDNESCPRSAVCIANVAMSGGMPVLLMTNPLKVPIKVVKAMPMISARIGLIPY